jgi:hypothetical protein
MAKIKMDDKFFGEVIENLKEEQHIDLELDADDGDDVAVITDIAIGLFQTMAKTMAKNKSESEDTTLELPGYIEGKVSFREGAEGNWGVGLTAGEEFKKIVKGDGEAEDIMDDEIEE